MLKLSKAGARLSKTRISPKTSTPIRCFIWIALTVALLAAESLTEPSWRILSEMAGSVTLMFGPVIVFLAPYTATST